MRPTLTLFEHQSVPFDWTDQDLFQLERLNRRCGAQVLRPTVQGTEKCLRAAEYVGVIRFGGHSVQVLPKIYKTNLTNPQEQAQQATANLLYFLSVAGQLQVKEQEISRLLDRKLSWLEILTRLYVTHLLDELQRGAFRNYQAVEDELPVLKGKWRIGAQLKHPHKRESFYVSYDEFSVDNTLNRLFRYVVEQLWRLTGSPENRRLLGIARQWLDQVKLLPVYPLAMLEGVYLNRLNRRYDPLLNMSRLFLAGGIPQIGVGGRQVYAFVFDMNALYEAFIINFMRTYKDTLPPKFTGCELVPQARGVSRHLATSERRKSFHLKPDLAFKHNDTFPLLLDTKYKLLRKGNRDLSIATADFYQMYAYARRYHCRDVLLLYPQTVDMLEPVRARYTLEEFGGRIRVETIDLRDDLYTLTGKQNLIQQLYTILEG